MYPKEQWLSLGSVPSWFPTLNWCCLQWWSLATSVQYDKSCWWSLQWCGKSGCRQGMHIGSSLFFKGLYSVGELEIRIHVSLTIRWTTLRCFTYMIYFHVRTYFSKHLLQFGGSWNISPLTLCYKWFAIQSARFSRMQPTVICMYVCIRLATRSFTWKFGFEEHNPIV